MSTFDSHPAFRPDRPRSLQRIDLNAIRAVCPIGAPEACALVWAAIQDEAAVPGALAALKALPPAIQSQIHTDSIAFLAAPSIQARRRSA